MTVTTTVPATDATAARPGVVTGVAVTVPTAPPIAARPAPSRPDPTLLRWGTDLAGRHRADPTDAGRCGNRQCRVAYRYPCPMRRMADRLIAASQAGWPDTWTARIDALSCGVTPDAGMLPASPAALMPGRDR